MTRYFIEITVTILAAVALGSWLGRRSVGARPFSPMVGTGFVSLLFVLWFGGAWFARPYADTDRSGWQIAEWFAFSGKWWVLLAAAMFVHGLARARKQIPSSPSQRTLYLLAMLLITGLVITRTVPIYFLLGEGRRDRNHFLIESKNYDYTCGGVALLNYLEQYRGVTGLTERSISQACRTTVEGSTTLALLRAARSHGLTNATARVLSWDQLAKHRRPVIVSISTTPEVRHATLLVKIGPEQLYFIDPADGPWTVSRERFLEIWYGKTILFE